jgi:CRP-like cAMP-binding protein
MAVIFDDRITRFLSKYQLLKFRKKDVILRAEDVPQGVYYILKGYVRVYSITPSGNELTLNLFKPGSLFPLTWALSDIENGYFYEAMTPVDVYRAPKEDFFDFIKSDKEILLEMIKRILVSLNTQTARMQYLTMGNAEDRIINTLLLLASVSGARFDGVIKIGIPVTQQDVANFSSVTRETASVEINRLIKQKLLMKKRKYYLIDDIELLKDRSPVFTKTLSFPYNF